MMDKICICIFTLDPSVWTVAMNFGLAYIGFDFDVAAFSLDQPIEFTCRTIHRELIIGDFGCAICGNVIWMATNRRNLHSELGCQGIDVVG